MIDHIMINATNYESAQKFYSWLLPKLGYSNKMVTEHSTGFMSQDGALWLSRTQKDMTEQFDKHRVGLREIAFSAQNRDIIDQIAKDIETNGGKIIELPYQNSKGAYQFFFTDPDGIKLEIINRK